MQGVNSIVVGLPDCGEVCKNKHLPGFVKRASDLKKAGFSQVLVASVTTPEKLKTFLQECGGVGIGALADVNGSFTRMLGLEINNPGTTPPYSQRYVGFVQDGALVRLARSAFLISSVMCRAVAKRGKSCRHRLQFWNACASHNPLSCYSCDLLPLAGTPRPLYDMRPTL
jgi:hypothetical protein